jgi:hypothetical protein
MNLINKLNSDPSQRAFLTGNAGQRIEINLRYLPTQSMWMVDFELDDFIVKNISLVCSPNLLRNYKNIIPFGIMVDTVDGQDPRGVTDFASQYAKLYLLSRDEVIAIEERLYE